MITFESLLKVGKGTVIIMRGPSGCGKSHESALLAAGIPLGVRIVSSDAFFEGREGRESQDYTFDVKMLAESHAWCRCEFLRALKDRVDVIIVDNTNCRIWEFREYELAADLVGYKVLRVDCFDPKTNTIEDLRKFAQRNLHAVPLDVILKQAANFVPG